MDDICKVDGSLCTLNVVYLLFSFQAVEKAKAIVGGMSDQSQVQCVVETLPELQGHSKVRLAIFLLLDLPPLDTVGQWGTGT